MAVSTLPREVSSLESAGKVYKMVKNPRRVRYQETSHETTSLQPVELRYCVLSNCTVNDCLLIECLVQDSHIVNSTLNNCIIVNEMIMRPLPYRLHSRIRSSHLQECNMKESMIFGSKVCGGQVADCRVETSIFSLGNTGDAGGAIISYRLFFQDCTIEDAKLYQGSKFHACQLERCEDEGSEHSSAPLPFKNFPVEIREHILKYAFEQRYE
jgi:hypothetical protein